MDIEKYQTLTGITVADSEQALIKASIRKTKSILENLLGYSLSKSEANDNQYEEKGKSAADCLFGNDIDEDNLLPADSVTGAYRLFSYNNADEFFMTDPFTRLYKVKLVFIKPGEDPNGVTIKTFDDDDIRVHMKQGFSKYIQRCEDCFCLCACDDCIQIAIDADWMFEGCLPDELLYVWCDMVTYESDCKKDIKSESLGTHSYTKFDRKDPQFFDSNIAVIKKYAGPNGSVGQIPTL